MLTFQFRKDCLNKKGYDDLNNLHMSILKHERSQRHIRSLIDLKTFGKVRIDLQLDASKKLSIQHHNEKVKYYNYFLVFRKVRWSCIA